MEFQKILSGKEKVQILHLGFRMKWNKGPQGPNHTTYFKCVEKSCKATLATLGELSGELSLKFHHHEQHNHRADVSKNIVSATLHEFRGEVKAPESKNRRRCKHPFVRGFGQHVRWEALLPWTHKNLLGGLHV